MFFKFGAGAIDAVDSWNCVLWTRSIGAAGATVMHPAYAVGARPRKGRVSQWGGGRKLAVVSREVLDTGDGRETSDCGVTTVVIVQMQPRSESSCALGFRLVEADVGPLVEPWYGESARPSRWSVDGRVESAWSGCRRSDRSLGIACCGRRRRCRCRQCVSLHRGWRTRRTPGAGKRWRFRRVRWRALRSRRDGSGRQRRKWMKA